MLLAEGDPHPAVFDLLSAALGRLDHPGAPAMAVLAYFQWRLLQHVGVLGDMAACVNCGRSISPARVYFTSREGGLLCGKCSGNWSEKRPVTSKCLAGIEALSGFSGPISPQGRSPRQQKSSLALDFLLRLGRQLI